MTWDQFWQHVSEHYEAWPSPAIVAFEGIVVVAAVLTILFLRSRIERVWQHFLLVAVGIFLIEFFTAPMWKNLNLGFWAYVYSDVSWIHTLAWTTLILLTVYVVDMRIRLAAPWQRFAACLLILTPAALVLEAFNVALGIRAYSPETLDAAGPMRIPLLNVPAAGLYYVPVFMTLVLSFYKHWLPVVVGQGQRVHRVSVIKRLLLLTVGVFLFEIVVEPMANNVGFPAWSYVYHDITVVMTAFWVALVALCSLIVDRLLPRADFRLRFAAILALLTLIATPIEGWFINSGLRVYGPSATADFLGFRTLIGDLPVEVVAAIPIYLSLVIAFVRYWDGSVDRTLGMTPRLEHPERIAVESASRTIDAPA